MFNYINMHKIIKITFIIILILSCMHLYKFKKYTNTYQIQQQELDYIEGNDLYNQLNPLIITFIEDTSLMNNIIKYRLYSAMSFNKKKFYV